jgi:hypothetical protein
MARLYESSSDYGEHLTYAGDPVDVDIYDSEFGYDRAELSYDGDPIDVAQGYASPNISYGDGSQGYNGSVTVATTATGAGTGASTTTGVRTTSRTATGVGTGTSNNAILHEQLRTGYGAGGATTNDTADVLHAHVRTLTSATAGSSTTTTNHIAFHRKTANGSGVGTSTVTSIVVIDRTGSSNAYGSHFAVYKREHLRAVTNAGTSAVTILSTHVHPRTSSDTATSSSVIESNRFFAVTATANGLGTSSVTQEHTHLRDGSATGTSSQTSTEAHTHLRGATGAGTASSNNTIQRGHLRTAWAQGGATTGDTAELLHVHLRGSTDVGTGTSTIVRIVVVLRTVHDATQGNSVTVSRSKLERIGSSAGTSTSVVEYYVTHPRTASGSGTSEYVITERIRRMARYQLDNVIDRVRRHLNSSLRHETNVLSVNFTATDTVLTLAYDLSTSIRPGSILSVGTELCRVVSFEAISKEITVVRGWQDSSVEEHGPGSEVLINPRFTRFDIFDAIIDEIAAWETEIFKVQDHQWEINGDTDSVELPVEYIDAIGVCRVTRQWEGNDSTSWPRIKYRLQRGSVSEWDGALSSGLVIRLVFENNMRRTGKVHALIAMPFDVTMTLVGTTNLASEMGMTPSQIDLLVQGVKVRLLADDENIRSSRQAANAALAINQYNAQSNLDHLQVARANYIRRYNEEITKIRARYPVKSW